MFNIRSAAAAAKTRRRCAFFLPSLVSQTTVQQNLWTPVRSNVPILLFPDPSQSGTLGGSASVAFSEQEEGGINDSYRNEVAAGPPGVGEEVGGLRLSYVAFVERSAVIVVSYDGKLRHYLCLCECQTEREDEPDLSSALPSWRLPSRI